MAFYFYQYAGKASHLQKKSDSCPALGSAAPGQGEAQAAASSDRLVLERGVAVM